jgi:hypothetical protein
MALKNNRPVIIFANPHSERDYLRNMLFALSITISCFEKQTICFDNLASIHLQLVVGRTGSKTTSWLLILALNALKLDGRRFHFPNAFYVHKLNMSHDGTITFPLTWIYGFNNPADKINLVLTINGFSPKRNRHGVLIGTSPSIKSIKSKLHSLAQASDPDLFGNQADTGKELLARMIANYTNDDAIFIKIDSKALAGVEKEPCAMSSLSRCKKIYEVVVSKLKSICDQFGYKTEKNSYAKSWKPPTGIAKTRLLYCASAINPC